MEIKRSEMLQWAQSAQLNAESHNDVQTERAHTTSASRHTTVSIDALRTKVLGLQQEVHDLQTGISSRQIQMSFLNQVGEGSAWQKELRRFMNEQFPSLYLELKENQNLDEFKAETTTSITQLRENLLKKEIQIQNIISAGIFEPTQGNDTDEMAAANNSEIIKDYTASRDMFTKLRPDTVKNLLH
ncbi:MAG TPA: hypothetical protein PLY93_01335 [Turneriella sp.]|nr:hypothetical protein [Turneriella sp.]